MAEINLLDQYPRSKRPIEERGKQVTEENRKIGRQFGREYFDGDAVCLVEWPEKAADLLPPADIDILLLDPGRGRDALLTAHTQAGEKCLEAVSQLKSQEGYS